MKIIPLLLLALVSDPAFAKLKSKRVELLDRLEAGCNEMLADKGHAKALKTCACLRKNTDQKVSNKELEILARAYEGDDKAEKELKEEKNEALDTFDSDLAESCLENPNYTVGTGESDD